MKAVRLSFLAGLILALAWSLAACTPVETGIVTDSAATAPPEEKATGTPLPPEPSSTPIPTPTPVPELTAAGLKYRLLAEFPDFFYCDPDFYPVARADEAELAVQRFPELQADAETFQAILMHLDLAEAVEYSAEQQLSIYREYKKLAALVLDQSDSAYRYQIQVAAEIGPGELISGQIDAQGLITVAERIDTIASCPICLSAGTRIDTPEGSQPVESLRPGTLVWTLDETGQRIAVPLVRVSRTLSPPEHQVVHLVLDDGRQLWVSPGHPTADGRRVGALRPGDRIGDGMVLSATRVEYHQAATYDLLPAGETGLYWANGILLGSTLAP